MPVGFVCCRSAKYAMLASSQAPISLARFLPTVKVRACARRLQAKADDRPSVRPKMYVDRESRPSPWHGCPCFRRLDAVAGKRVDGLPLLAGDRLDKGTAEEQSVGPLSSSP